uniref:Glycosyl transferase family 25 domain-containing protein n=1 Tax=viral metagenome TaxID=1070528 RepID=A0A6C0LHF3_9ZZZZ
MNNCNIDINNILNNYKVDIYEITNTKKKTFINMRIKKIFVINLADNTIRRNYILMLMKKYNINFSLIVVNRISQKVHSLIKNNRITKEELGCTLSHMWCLREIIKNNYENAIIFEDDIIFHKNFKEMFMDIFQHEYDFLLLGACDFSFQHLHKKLLLNTDNELQIKNQIIDHVDNISEQQDNTFEEQQDNTLQEDTFEEHQENTLQEDTFEEPPEDTIPEIQFVTKEMNTLDSVSSVKNMYRPDQNAVKVYGAHANYYSLHGAKVMFESKRDNISFFDKSYLLMFDTFENTSFICYPNLVVSDISTSNLNHSYPFLSKSEDSYYKRCFDNFQFTDYNFIYLDIILKHKSVNIREDDSVESYITRLIKYQFQSVTERELIKNRHVFDFFTIRDLEKIKFNL